MFLIPDEVGAISLDIWDTLIGPNKRFAKKRLKRTFKLLGHGHIDVDRLYPAYKQANVFFTKLSEQTGADFGMRERIAMMYELLGITASPPSPTMVEWLQREAAKLRLVPENMPPLLEPDVCQTLQCLRNSRFKIGILSNTGMDNEIVMGAVLKQFGIWNLVDTVVFSCEDGRAKPNPGLFRDMATRLGVSPDETLHVGDNRIADYGAVKAGLHAALYAPNGSDLPHVTSLKELKRHTDNEMCTVCT